MGPAGPLPPLFETRGLSIEAGRGRRGLSPKGLRGERPKRCFRPADEGVAVAEEGVAAAAIGVAWGAPRGVEAMSASPPSLWRRGTLRGVSKSPPAPMSRSLAMSLAASYTEGLGVPVRKALTADPKGVAGSLDGVVRLVEGVEGVAARLPPPPCGSAVPRVLGEVPDPARVWCGTPPPCRSGATAMADEALEEAEEKAAAVDVAEVVRRGVPSVSDSRRTQPGERWLAGVLGGTPPEANAAEAAFVERGVGGHTAAEHLAAAAACACAGGCCWPGLPPSRATGGAPALRGPLRL
jgi:hypothetical protein